MQKIGEDFAFNLSKGSIIKDGEIVSQIRECQVRSDFYLKTIKINIEFEIPIEVYEDCFKKREDKEINSLEASKRKINFKIT